MPIIRIAFIKDVVANADQKKELIIKMTDTFVSVVGEVVRPFVYTLIEETPQQEWGIAGKPMPDLPFLTGEEYYAYHATSKALMEGWMKQMADAAAATEATPEA